MSSIKISHPTRKIKARVQLPGSKSESNRLLILNALMGNQLKLENLSDARDTTNLAKILQANDPVVDVVDAGTSMRFLTAYYAATNQAKTITGSERMKQRPIKPLVTALSEIGFDVRYKGEDGFPPVEIIPIKSLDKLEGEVSIEGNISSQFITALLLIAPVLPKGLKIYFTTPLTSRPYVYMTLDILKHFGVEGKMESESVSVQHSTFNIQPYKVGADWSAASYWYSIAFLADEAEIMLLGLKDEYVQGDREIADWMKRFGISTEFTAEGALIKKTSDNHPRMMKMGFKDNPDLVQTIMAMFAAKNIYSTANGVDSLKIKETDRIAALQNELKKVNVHFHYNDLFELHEIKGTYQSPSTPISTYNDHRMAMSFAPLALMGEIEIENPEVVEKSYPGFWKELEKAGFSLK